MVVVSLLAASGWACSPGSTPTHLPVPPVAGSTLWMQGEFNPNAVLVDGVPVQYEVDRDLPYGWGRIVLDVPVDAGQWVELDDVAWNAPVPGQRLEAQVHSAPESGPSRLVEVRFGGASRDLPCVRSGWSRAVDLDLSAGDDLLVLRDVDGDVEADLVYAGLADVGRTERWWRAGYGKRPTCFQVERVQLSGDVIDDGVVCSNELLPASCSTGRLPGWAVLLGWGWLVFRRRR